MWEESELIYFFFRKKKKKKEIREEKAGGALFWLFKYIYLLYYTMCYEHYHIILFH